MNLKNNNKQDEFVPFDYFTSLARFWWVVVLCGLLGGIAGLIIHGLRPAIYEAQAVVTASIDYNKIDFIHPPKPTPAPVTVPYQFSQYDEDLALSEVEISLTQVVPQVLTFAQQNGIRIDATSFLEQSTVERKHAFWDIRFRNADPALAQKVVNYWTQQGLADLKAKSSAGKLQPYITFDLVQLADLPKNPAYFQTNSFVLSGGLLGLLAGFLAVNLPFFRKEKGR